jgi:hypothetical protein
MVASRGPVRFAGVEERTDAVVREVREPERDALDVLDEVVDAFAGLVTWERCQARRPSMTSSSLIATTAFESGITLLCYRPAPDQQASAAT